MVTPKKLKEMRHKYDTQSNESLNMRHAEFAPKNKNFSRGPALNIRMKNVIGIHNKGYDRFYQTVMEKTKVIKTNIINKWLINQDRRVKKEHEDDQKVETKWKRKHKRKRMSRNEL